jgi:TPR repeat protein
MVRLTGFTAMLALAGSLCSAPASADAYTDEANRQSIMSSMRAQDAANDRASADRAFQSGLAQQRSSSGGSSGGSSMGSSGSGTALDGLVNAMASDPLPEGPQSVVARRTLIIQVQETPQQVVTRLTGIASGDPQAAFDLARLLYTGYGGVPRDDAQARRWFAVAADAGNPDAQAQVGYMARNGLGGAEDRALALAQTARAAAQGHAYGAGLNGLYRIETITDDRADPQAVANLVRAADAGHLFAQVALGTLVYELGVGTAVDWDRAAHYARLAADRGHPLALLELGRMTMTGRGVRQDLPAGAALIRRSADAGDAAGMAMYGQLLMTGQGVRQDAAAGAGWFRRAADLGNANAAGVYGMALMIGEGVPEDFETGLRYTRQGAEGNDPQAMTNLGRVLFVGQNGVPVDQARAVSLFRAAADAGFQEAVELMADPEVRAIVNAGGGRRTKGG